MNGSARKPRSKFCVLHGRRAAQKRRKVGQVEGDSGFSLSRERGDCEGRRGRGVWSNTGQFYFFSHIYQYNHPIFLYIFMYFTLKGTPHICYLILE